VANQVHLCPKDGAQLSRFTDQNFPAGIFVERCPSCNGFWLNRGEFTKFQRARQAMLPPKEPTPEDKKLQEQIQSILADQKNGDTESVLSKLNAFLSQPVGSSNTLTLDSNDNSTEGANPVGAVMSVAMTLLRLFVFK
jgi:Zn-finger nucleic acid-binding protein